jgi:hypothetical protein
MLLRSTLNPHSIRPRQQLQTPFYYYQVRIIKKIKVLGGRGFAAIQASQVIQLVAAVFRRERKEVCAQEQEAEEESLTQS